MATSESHQRLVDELARCVQRVFYIPENAVFEMARGKLAPSKIDGVVPDLYLKSDYNEVIGVADTCEDLSSRHSDAQLATLIKRTHDSRGAYFLLAVPVGALGKARSRLDRIDPDWLGFAWIMPF